MGLEKPLIELSQEEDLREYLSSYLNLKDITQTDEVSFLDLD